MKKWKVSVLTPVHQTPIELLERAYGSLQRQSYGFSEIQWVVVLHNCRQEYIRRVRDLLAGQPNITLTEVCEEGTGVSFARNTTLERAQGDYLFFLDSDDEMRPDCIRTILHEMEENGADTAIYTAAVSGGGGLKTYYTDVDPELGTQVLDAGDPRISGSMCISGMTLWTRCYKRDLVIREGARFDESLPFGEDFLFNIFLTGRAKRVLVLPQLTGYVYYAGIGMTDAILATAGTVSLSRTESRTDWEAALWENEGTGLFLRSVRRAGRRCGLDLTNVLWVLLSQFGRLYLFSNMPKALKDNFLATIRPLVYRLHPPVMAWKEKQAEADSCCAFVRALVQMPLKEPCISKEEKHPVVFVFVNPAWGHVTPLLGVMRALVQKGFHVRVFSGEEQADRIRQTGAVYVSCDDIYDDIDLTDREALGLYKWIEYARRMDPVIGREAGRWQPVLAIVDASTVWGRLLAEKYALPVVFSSATMIMSFRTYSYWKPLIEELGPHMEEINRSLLRLHGEGFPLKDLVGLYLIRDSDPCVTYTSRLTQPKAECFPAANTYFAGFSHLPEPTERAEYDGNKRPLIYVTLGTVSSINVWFFRSCMIAFREMDVDVVMVIWKNVLPAQLGEIPPNVTLKVSVNQEEILRRADAALFHAGLNTMSDCLLLGVPMIAYPSFGEQYGNARRLEELRAGIVIDNYRPDTIRQAVRAVLSDGQYRNRARSVGEDMRRYRGAAGAADWICGRMEEQSADRAADRDSDMDTDRDAQCPGHAGIRLIESSAYAYLFNRKTTLPSEEGAPQKARHELVPVYMEINLQEAVRMTALQRAVDDTAERFPLTGQAVVETEKGFFAAEMAERILVRPLSALPEEGSGPPSDGRNLMVYASGQTILVIVDHAQMDGYGLAAVTGYLMKRYFLYLKEPPSAGQSRSPEKKLSCSETAAEMKDPMKLPSGDAWDPLPELSGRPWRIPFEKGDALIGLQIGTEPVLRLSGRIRTSPGILFMALIAEALGRLYPQSCREKLKAALPADYRQVLGCDHTLRNCSWPVFFEPAGQGMAAASTEERARFMREQLKQQMSVRKANSWIRFYKALAGIASGRAGKTGQPGPAFECTDTASGMETAAGTDDTERTGPADAPYSFLLSYLRIEPQADFDGAEFFYHFGSAPELFTMLEYGGHFHLWMPRMKPGENGRKAEQVLSEVFAGAGLSVRLSERRRRILHFTVPRIG